MSLQFGKRRAVYMDIGEELKRRESPISEAKVGHLESLDLIYRSLCALLFNYVPQSGHPGGSISSGKTVSALLFDTMDYDVSDPDREDSDIISYSAGHKALGLYALWALRNEALRIAAPSLLPKDENRQLRLEDLLGFRRNPVTTTPLFVKFHSKALDGHPTPTTPFVRLSTGASGVGVCSSLGLALGARDYFGKNAPRVHLIEGEGGLTPGRASEALAAAGTGSLDNAFMHVDWNQSSIDSDRVCRENGVPGDYVQWTPMELLYLHDWNVIYVPNGRDFHQVISAQRRALSLDNGQPTAIVYRTVKGWQYGITGRASHGAGHALCADGFYEALAPLTDMMGILLPRCEGQEQRCAEEDGEVVMEACFWEALCLIRQAMEQKRQMVDFLAEQLGASGQRLQRRKRSPRKNAPRVEAIYEIASQSAQPPEQLTLTPGAKTTLRAELGRVLGYLNEASDGAIMTAAADLLGSTSVNKIGEKYPDGYYHASSNPGARLMSIGGICEDAISGMMSGLGTFGRHIGAGSSYGAFIAPLGHVAARLHAIGNQARNSVTKEPYRPLILVCAHTGLKTGEDGPTHADPQALQLVQENFPKGTSMTLTPWSPQEVWPLVVAALDRRPAIIIPFVTRPSEKVIDLKGCGLEDPVLANHGLYLLRRARNQADGAVVLQGSGVTYAFVEEALPLLENDGIELDVYYVTSAELFDLLPPDEQDRLFPSEIAQKAMGITGFTLPTMYRWIRSAKGRAATLHPFRKGHYLGSGQAHMVLKEAGLDGRSQYAAIKRYVEKS